MVSVDRSCDDDRLVVNEIIASNHDRLEFVITIVHLCAPDVVEETAEDPVAEEPAEEIQEQPRGESLILSVRFECALIRGRIF